MTEPRPRTPTLWPNTVKWVKITINASFSKLLRTSIAPKCVMRVFCVQSTLVSLEQRTQGQFSQLEQSLTHQDWQVLSVRHFFFCLKREQYSAFILTSPKQSRSSLEKSQFLPPYKEQLMSTSDVRRRGRRRRTRPYAVATSDPTFDQHLSPCLACYWIFQ